MNTDTFTHERGHIHAEWGQRLGSIIHVLIPIFSSPYCSHLAGRNGGFLLLRLSVVSPEDLTDPTVTERLMQQVSGLFLCQGAEKRERFSGALGKICRI